MDWFRWSEMSTEEHKVLLDALSEWWDDLSAEDKLAHIGNLHYTEAWMQSQIMEEIRERGGMPWVKNRYPWLYDVYKEKAKKEGLQVEED
jgi:hypothetical protein